MAVFFYPLGDSIEVTKIMPVDEMFLNSTQKNFPRGFFVLIFFFKNQNKNMFCVICMEVCVYVFFFFVYIFFVIHKKKGTEKWVACFFFWQYLPISFSDFIFQIPFMALIFIHSVEIIKYNLLQVFYNLKKRGILFNFNFNSKKKYLTRALNI